MADKFTFKQFQAQYPDDDACLMSVLKRKHGDCITCPSCGLVDAKFHKITGRRAYACQDCGYHLYPCVGTPFEHSSTPLTLWFHAMYLMTATRNGVSAKELERQLGVTYKCAWRIGHQLRELMAARDAANNPGPMSGHVELDETYVGGKEKNKHASKRTKGTQGFGSTKTKAVVFGMLERDGNIKCEVVSDSNRATLEPIIKANVAQGSTISTDELVSYKQLPKLGYTHGTVQHGIEEYVNGIHHINGTEGFWSHLKRGISSTHVSVSSKHLQKYVDEFGFRYNNRHAPAEMFQRMLTQISKNSTSS